MKLTLRPEWRPRAVSSFLGFLDLKTGVKIVILFAVLNKVAGIYGLIAIFTGGTLAQVSMYIYSVAALGAYYWGLKAIAEESSSKSLMTAHIFLVDHLISTIWTLFFAVNWWVYNPHDGQRQANSEAQKELASVGPGHGTPMSDEERLAAAQIIWNREKGLAGSVIFIGWLLKAYFALLVYSYAIHLRKNTYRSLPLTVLSKQRAEAAAAGSSADDFSYHPVYENELEVDPLDPAYNPQKNWDRERERDIDYDSSDYDENDLERGRGRGRRGVGGGLSIGSYDEFTGAGPATPKQANGTHRPTSQKGSKSANHSNQSSIASVLSNAGNRHIVPSRPLAPTTRKPSQLSKSQLPPTDDTSKGQKTKATRDIQNQLEHGGEEVLWDNDDDDDGDGDIGTPKSSRPPTQLRDTALTSRGLKQTSSESESGDVSRRAS